MRNNHKRTDVTGAATSRYHGDNRPTMASIGHNESTACVSSVFGAISGVSASRPVTVAKHRIRAAETVTLRIQRLPVAGYKLRCIHNARQTRNQESPILHTFQQTILLQHEHNARVQNTTN